MKILSFTISTVRSRASSYHFGSRARPEPAKVGTPNSVGRHFRAFGVPPLGGQGHSVNCCSRARGLVAGLLLMLAVAFSSGCHKQHAAPVPPPDVLEKAFQALTGLLAAFRR